MGWDFLDEKVLIICYIKKMKKKQTAIEFLMSMPRKKREAMMSAFQQLDEDLRKKRQSKTKEIN